MIPGGSRIVDAALRAGRGPLGHGLAGLLDRAARWPSDGLAVITYHRVAPLGARTDLHPGLRSADPVSFRRQAEDLARRSAVVDLAAVLAAVDGGAPLPKRAVLITFDDAYLDVAEHAWPVLRELGLPAVLFVPTGFPDGGGAFWWDRLHAAIEHGQQPALLTALGRELRLDSSVGRSGAFRWLREQVKEMPHAEALAVVDGIVAELRGPAVAPSVIGWDGLRAMAGAGLTLAPHSRSHPILPTVDDATLAAELERPLEDLRREIGSAPPALAYPSGVHDARVRAAARAAGYRLGFSTRRAAIPSIRRADPLALPRINVGVRADATLLRLQMNPLVNRLMVRERHTPPHDAWGRGRT